MCMLTLVRLAISGLRLLRLFMHRLVRFAVSDGYNAISCDCLDVLRSANFRRGEPRKPQLIVRRAQAPPVPSFRITHCLAGLVKSVILFYYRFIYLYVCVVLMLYNVIMFITRKGVFLSLSLCLSLSLSSLSISLSHVYLSVCPLYRLSALVDIDN